ncbi:MAG: FAD-dependent oxidoreductase [Patescibacteria group bacterium]
MLYTKELPITREVDVIVAGGGTAGLMAAVAAARAGARTALVERHGFLGGCAVFGATSLHCFYNIFKPERVPEKQVVRGLAQELVDRLRERGGSLGHVEMERGYDFVSRLTLSDPEDYKLVAQEMAAGAGVDLLLHTWIADVLAGDGRIEGLVCASKSGPEVLRAKVYVDATGDGDVAAGAGAPCLDVRGADNPYGVSLTFRLGHVDLERAAAALDRAGALWQLARGVKAGRNTPDIIRLGGHFGPWREEAERDGLNRWFFANSVRPDEFTYVNATWIHPADILSRDDLSRCELLARRQVHRTVDFFRRRIDGFQDAYLSATVAQLGTRRSRIVETLYDLSREDVLQGRGFADEIARFSFIDNPDYNVAGGGSYGIPYRCLVPRGVGNLLVAGRMISSDLVVHNSTRNTVCCMAQGQAAGVAAALCAASGEAPARLDTALLRRELASQGAYFEG